MDRQQQASGAKPGAIGPHDFVEPPDAQSAVVQGAGQVSLQQTPAVLAVEEASLRPVFCAHAGCGKPREDPIHSPSE